MNNIRKNAKEIVMTAIICCATLVAQAQLAGSGSVEDPFLVSSVADLQEFAASVNAGETTYNNNGVTVALAADLDMADVEFPGIGTEEFGFVGTFDGCNHSISNFAIEDYNVEAGVLGFFKFLGSFEDGSEGTVRNITFRGLTICAYGFCDAMGLVGVCAAGTIENVLVRDAVDVYGVYSVGAIIGYAYHVEISDCEIRGRSGSSVTGYCSVGAFAGFIEDGCLISGCKVRNLDVIGDEFVDDFVGEGYGEIEIVDSEFVKPMLFGGGFGGGFGAGSGDTEEDEEEEVEPAGTPIPFEAMAPETEYGAEYFAAVRDFADYLATNGCNCAEFKSENLDLVRFAMWVANYSDADSVEELLSAENLFAAYAFNLPCATFAGSSISLSTEILSGTPEDGWTTIIFHVKAGDTELNIDTINANIVLKYGESLDSMTEYSIENGDIETFEDAEGNVRTALVIGPPEGASAFFSVSLR